MIKSIFCLTLLSSALFASIDNKVIENFYIKDGKKVYKPMLTNTAKPMRVEAALKKQREKILKGIFVDFQK